MQWCRRTEILTCHQLSLASRSFPVAKLSASSGDELADTTTPTSGATTPVPPEQMVGDDGTVISPGGNAPAPVTTNAEVVNSDDTKAKLAPTHVVDDPQPQAQDFCP